jgi:signal transduction histidine kinase
MSSLSATEARHELYTIMNSDEPFEDKAEQALLLGQRYLGVENGHLTKIDIESDYWKAMVSTDPPDGQFPPDLILDLGTTYCRRTLDEGPVTLHNAGEQGWEEDPAYREHELDTYHGTALMVDDEPYGTVCFVSNDTRSEPFSAEETMFAELVSRMLEHELRHARTLDKVERLERFASVVSHDLRNPLTVAQGNIELERQQRGDSEQLAAAGHALERMGELISDVLAIARQGQEIEELTSVSLASIVSECWDSIDAPDSQLRVAGDCTFKAEPQRLTQLFENLFRNAFEHGGSDVTVTVGPLEDADGFYIEDTGPGVSEEVRSEIFDSGYTTGDEGLGLGLSIVDGVVNAHGWAIAVTDSESGGARFEVSDVIVEQ